MKDLHVVHVVRRLGPVGGMESYVWHLVHGLSAKGLSVSVVCERVYEAPNEAIRVINIEPAPERPRWKAMETFRARVNRAIKQVFHSEKIIVHSHERSLGHQVTTFHGPPIISDPFVKFLSKFNRRLTAWSNMEIEELMTDNVQMILAVSSRVKEQLVVCYPSLAERTFELAWPGVEPPTLVGPVVLVEDVAPYRFLFIGKEWRRKGLDLAIKVVSEFRRSGREATLTIFGPDRDELPRSIRSLTWIEVMGWSKTVSWAKFHLMIHPARKEPFGMVVAEARANGVPVLMSNNVGALDLNYTDTVALPLETSLETWCYAISRLLKQATRESEIKWTWSNLVEKHVQDIYPRIEAILGRDLKQLAKKRRYFA